jgi:hypothetical protein
MGGEMRQASWVAFLLLAVGLLTYEATVDQQDVAAGISPDSGLADGGGGAPPPPKP